MANSDRIHFLGNLRAFVILLVILLHGSLTYMVNAPVWWYVVDPQSSLLFTVLVLLVDVPIMQAMFFISGYLAMPSLQKRGAAGFLKEKVVRIGIPWRQVCRLLHGQQGFLDPPLLPEQCPHHLPAESVTRKTPRQPPGERFHFGIKPVIEQRHQRTHFLCAGRLCRANTPRRRAYRR